MDQIAASLSAQPYALKPTELWVPSSAVNDAKQTGYFEAMRDVEDARQAAWWAENGDRIRAEHEEARRGWAIQDALAEIRRTMEALQHEPAIVDDLIATLSRTLWRKSAPLGAVVQRYQPLTSVDLTVVLQSWGIEPDDYP